MASRGILEALSILSKSVREIELGSTFELKAMQKELAVALDVSEKSLTKVESDLLKEMKISMIDSSLIKDGQFLLKNEVLEVEELSKSILRGELTPMLKELKIGEEFIENIKSYEDFIKLETSIKNNALILHNDALKLIESRKLMTLLKETENLSNENKTLFKELMTKTSVAESEIEKSSLLKKVLKTVLSKTPGMIVGGLLVIPSAVLYINKTIKEREGPFLKTLDPKTGSVIRQRIRGEYACGFTNKDGPVNHPLEEIIKRSLKKETLTFEVLCENKLHWGLCGGWCGKRQIIRDNLDALEKFNMFLECKTYTMYDFLHDASETLGKSISSIFSGLVSGFFKDELIYSFLVGLGTFFGSFYIFSRSKMTKRFSLIFSLVIAIIVSVVIYFYLNTRRMAMRSFAYKKANKEKTIND